VTVLAPQYDRYEKAERQKDTISDNARLSDIKETGSENFQDFAGI
jgi:hypothetical protein